MKKPIKNETTFYITQTRYDGREVLTKNELETDLADACFDTGTVVMEVKVVKKYKVKIPALEAMLVEIK